MQKVPVNFKDGVIIEDYMWVFDNLMQAMCKMNLQTYEMEVVDYYTGESDFQASWLIVKNRCVYLFSFENPGFLIYDLEHNSYTIIKNPNECQDTRVNRVTSVFLYKDTIWLFPAFYEGNIWRYNIETGEFTGEEKILNVAKTYSIYYQAILYPYIYNNVMWLAPLGTNVCLRYILDTGEVEVSEITNKKFRILSCAYDGRNILMTGVDDNGIYKLKDDNEAVLLNNSSAINMPYSTFHRIEDGFVLLPRNENNLVIIKNHGEEIYRIHIEELIYEKEAKDFRGKICNMCIADNKIYLFVHELKKLLVLNMNGQIYKEVEVTYLGDYGVDCVKVAYLKKNDIHETKDLTLEKFISFCKEN